MSAPSELVVTELDFDTIKAALITFMQSQTEFADYNFEGAALMHARCKRIGEVIAQRDEMAGDLEHLNAIAVVQAIP